MKVTIEFNVPDCLNEIPDKELVYHILRFYGRGDSIQLEKIEKSLDGSDNVQRS